MVGLYCFWPCQTVIIALGFIACYGIFIMFLTFCLRKNGFAKGFICFAIPASIRIIAGLNVCFLLCLVMPRLTPIGFVVKAPSCCFSLLAQNH